jgi:hypothetical protein
VKDWNEALCVYGLPALRAQLDAQNPPCPTKLARAAYFQQIRPFVLAGVSVPPLAEWIRLQTEPWTPKEEAELDKFLRRT